MRSKRIAGFLIMVFAALVFMAGLLWAAETTGTSTITDALQSFWAEAFKLLGVVVCLIITKLLGTMTTQVKDSFWKRKILDWAIEKAIKMEDAKFEALTNSQKWERLVEHANKLGITEAILKKFEAEIMAGVEAWKNQRRLLKS